MPELPDCSGYKYLRESAYDRKTIRGMPRPAIAETEPFKRYPDAEKIPLPTNWTLKEARITPLLQKRRSLRKYDKEPVSMEELAFMLWASQGITAKSGNYSFRTTPSAGALYPIETYFSANSVEDLDPGLYHFDVEKFSIDRLTTTNTAESMAAACLNQTFMAQAAVGFIWTAVIRRCMCKYGNRGMRYLFLDSGHICQNLVIAAEATGNGACPVAAFYDDEMNELLDINPEDETVLYAAAVGKRFVPKKQCSL